MRFKNNLGWSSTIAHTWDDKFAIEGAKIGDTLRLRDPVRFNVTKGRVMVESDVIETSKTLTLNTQAHVAFAFSSVEMTLNIDQFAERYLKSAAVALANQVDVDGLTMAYQATANAVGTPATPPTTMDIFYQAGEVIDSMSAPMDGQRYMCISPKLQTAVLKAAQGLFQSSTQIKQQYEKGRMGTMGGFDWIMDQNCPVHTVGPLGGAPLVAGGSQIGSTLLVSGFTASAASRLKKGDLFTLPTVYSVNPVSGVSTGDLQKFVVTADTSSAADGTASIPISPAIVVTGPTKTVTNSPAASAPLTIIGTANQLTPQGLGYHKQAFAIGMAPLDVPKGVHMASSQQDPETGVSIRCEVFYEGRNDLFVCRCDVLYGFVAQRPEWSVRIES